MFSPLVAIVLALLASLVLPLVGGSSRATCSFSLLQELIQTKRILLLLLELHWPSALYRPIGTSKLLVRNKSTKNKQEKTNE